MRGGDPETQTLLPLLSKDTDLAQIVLACTDHHLDSIPITIDSSYSATVVLAAEGYPGPYVRDNEITYTNSLPPSLHALKSTTPAQHSNPTL